MGGEKIGHLFFLIQRKIGTIGKQELILIPEQDR
jgi:hypothetical protein